MLPSFEGEPFRLASPVVSSRLRVNGQLRALNRELETGNWQLETGNRPYSGPAPHGPQIAAVPARSNRSGPTGICRSALYGDVVRTLERP